MANISQKVNLTANQRMDIAEFMAMQTNIENAVTRLVQLIGAPVVDPVTNIQWNVGGVLTASTITAVGADLKIGAGLEVMCKDGHIITQDADELITGVLPLGATKALMAKPLGETPTTPDNRRFWDNSIPQEVSQVTNTVSTRQLVFSLVPNTAADIENAVNTGDYVFVATVSSDGMTAAWQMAFPDSGTLELPSLLSIVKRLIGYENENSGVWAASCGGRYNTNSGGYSASSGGHQNTNSGTYSASSGGRNNTNSGVYSASSGGGFNANSGYGSASSGGERNTNSGDYSASSGGFNNTNSGTCSASSGGYSNTNSGNFSASVGGRYNTNLAAAIGGITLGGQHNINGGLQSVILGQYCENATDDVICGGYSTTLTPSGANQNLKWAISNKFGTAHFAEDVKIGGNVNDGSHATVMATAGSGNFQAEGNVYVGGDVDGVSAPKAKIIGVTGSAYIGGDIQVGGTVTAGTAVSTNPTVIIAASSGNIHTEGDVKIGGDATAGTASTVKITKASGNIHTEGDINIGGDADDGTNKKAQILGASGNFKNLGYMQHNYVARTATVGWGVDNTSKYYDAVISSAWAGDVPTYILDVTITRAAVAEMDIGESFAFDVPYAGALYGVTSAVAKVVSATGTNAATLKMTRWSVCQAIDASGIDKLFVTYHSPSTIALAADDVLVLRVIINVSHWATSI